MIFMILHLCFMTNIKVTNMKSTAGKSAKCTHPQDVLWINILANLRDEYCGGLSEWGGELPVCRNGISKAQANSSWLYCGPVHVCAMHTVWIIVYVRCVPRDLP